MKGSGYSAVAKCYGFDNAYTKIMERVSQRFKIVDKLYEADWVGESHLKSTLCAESVALQTRKIIEGMAFGCIVAADFRNEGQSSSLYKSYSASEIMTKLEKEGRLRLPEPVELDTAVEGGVSARYRNAPPMSKKDILGIYYGCDSLLHEPNPFSRAEWTINQVHFDGLRESIMALSSFLSVHMVQATTEFLVCSLWDGPEKKAAVIHAAPKG